MGWLGTIGIVGETWLYCTHCQRCYIAGEQRITDPGEYLVERCFYPDCTGHGTNHVLIWDVVRKQNPVYPSIPSYGEVYLQLPPRIQMASPTQPDLIDDDLDYTIDGHPPSEYQKRILQFIVYEKGDLIVAAVAGAGKTKTLLKTAFLIRVPKGIFLAFNNHIAAELKFQLLQTRMQSSTVHALGAKCLKDKLPGYTVQKDKYRRIAEQWVNSQIHLVYPELELKTAEREEFIHDLHNMVLFARVTLTAADNPEALTAMAMRFDLTTSDILLSCIAPVLEEGERIALDEGVIDFDDMLWLPYRWNLPTPRYQFIAVDEAQDLNALQLEFVLRLRASGGRMMFVGDENQAIMGFAGADTESFHQIKIRTGAIELPLSISYRCPRTHVVLARTIVPQIEARLDAPEGTILHIPEDNLPLYILPGDMIICRHTAPLVEWCLRLIRANKPAQVRGKDLGRMLFQVAGKIARQPSFVYEAFEKFVRLYEVSTSEWLRQRNATEGQILSLQDKCETLIVIRQMAGATSIEELYVAIVQLFSDDDKLAILSTVHKAKGLEADRIFILRPTSLPLTWPGQFEWELAQEKHIEYVAYTRSRDTLIFLDEETIEAAPETKSFRKTTPTLIETDHGKMGYKSKKS